jgi:FlaA1/EpsC-like NDP-sugar epimerase
VAVQPRRILELLVDSLLVCTTFLVTYLVFVDGRGTELQRGTFLAVLPILLGTTYVVYVLFGIYRRAWRYATTRDLATISLASTLATLAAVGIVVATRDLGDFPAGVFLAYGVSAAVLGALSRWCVRFVPEAAAREDDDRRRVLVVGAGRAGRAVARDLDADGIARVVAFLDDSPRLRRRRVQGIPVLGGTGDAAEALVTSRAEEVVVAIPDAPVERLELVSRACDAAGVPRRVVHASAVVVPAASRAIAE